MVGHSYCVALNRRLCHEVALAGGDRVAVTVVAPRFFRGDLRKIPLERLEGEPYRLEPVSVLGSQIPFAFVYGTRLIQVLRQPWDIVHAWEEPYILAGAQIARLTSDRSTLIYSSFQNQPKHYPPPLSWCERYAIDRAAGWTAFGETIIRNLADRPGYRDRPNRMIPLGVDGEVYRPDPAARQQILRDLNWSESGPPVIGYLGRFVPEKGLRLLMKTVEQLDAGSWRLLFIGGGQMESELLAWSARYPDQVRIVTGVHHSGVPSYLNAFDVLAAPSQTTIRWKEQLGRMLLEAMATGVPIIASDSGEIPHVVADVGRIVGEADEQGWVNALRELVSSPHMRKSLSDFGLERARSVYAWPHIAKAFLDFFEILRESPEANNIKPQDRPVPTYTR